MAYTTIDDPTAYFQANLHNGDGGTGQTLTFDGNSDLQLDFHWGKCRSESGRDWQVIDTVRGITKGLTTTTSAAEYTNSTYVTAIGSNGYSIGQNNDNNKAGETYVSYNWKAGTSVSGDTTGSGTLKTYTGSVNTDAGFSIIKYTGNGTSGHTIPHNLTQKPAMIIVKNLTGDNWTVYHHKIASDPATDYIFLNSEAAASDHVGYWNDTEPTSSVFTVGNDGGTNANNVSLIAYCFAEKQGYSKFSSYVGNGNADGTFVYTGFKPAFVMIKRSDASDSWCVFDNKRLGYNVNNYTLFANQSAAENTEASIDFTAQGFKLRGTQTRLNTSGGTYIYMAFAENPFVTSTDNGSIPACAR